MEVNRTAGLAAYELAETLQSIKESQIQTLIDGICGAGKVFVYGAGRSMLMLRCMAMRLMHLGFDSCVVGDTVTPAFGGNDLLILGSGSGETGSLIHIAAKAKQVGGKIAVITIKAESTLGRMADYVIEIPAYTDKVRYEGIEKTILPGGSLFEQSILLLSDAMVIPLGKRASTPTDQAFSRHANLE